MLLSSDSAVVTHVLNDPESDVILDAKLEDTVVTEPLTPAAVKVLISEAFEPSEPLISAAICADELTTEPSASPSSDVNLDAKLEDTLVNDPLTPAAVNVLISEALDPNDPLIFDAICALPLISVLPNSLSAVVILLLNEAEVPAVEPLKIKVPSALLILPDTIKLPLTVKSYALIWILSPQSLF